MPFAKNNVKTSKEEYYSQKTAAGRTVSNNFRKEHWLFQLPLLRSLIFFNFTRQGNVLYLINNQVYAYSYSIVWYKYVLGISNYLGTS